MKERKILFISGGKDTASTRYRSLQYFEYLEKSGFKPFHIVIQSDMLSHLRILKLAKRADFVVLIRKTLAFPFLEILRSCSKYLLFDFDDAIFTRADVTYSKTRKKRFVTTVKKCDFVWAGNPYLAKIAREHNQSVIVLPTSINPKKYLLKVEQPSEHVDIAWIGSSHTKKYLEMFLPIAKTLTRQFPTLRLKIIADFDLQYEGLCIKCTQWTEKNEAEDLASAHIGIAPLPDNAWTRGKCGLKILQYMAAGLPVVASAVGVQKRIVEHGETGYLANSPEEWEQLMKNLLKTTELMKMMGEKGRRKVCKSYSVSSVYREMLTSLERLLG